MTSKRELEQSLLDTIQQVRLIAQSVIVLVEELQRLRERVERLESRSPVESR